MEEVEKSYIVKFDGCYIYIIDASTNEIIQRFEVIDHCVRGDEDNRSFCGLTSDNEGQYIWNADRLDDGTVRLCIYSGADFRLYADGVSKQAGFIEELGEYLTDIIVRETGVLEVRIEPV